MQARTELLQLKERLQKQISVLESEMVTVDKAIQLLEREHQGGSEVHGSQDKRFRNVGLADACRRIVISDNWLSPFDVRNAMLQGGFKSDDKTKLLSAVFATLKRLGQSELEGKKVDGKLKYRRRQAVALSSAEAA
jgi:hypothetical protein